MVVPPKHPKMIILSRKIPWLLGKPTILGNPHIWTNHWFSGDIGSFSGEHKSGRLSSPRCWVAPSQLKNHRMFLPYSIGFMGLVYLATWMVDFYSKCVGKLTSSMDPLGIKNYSCVSWADFFPCGGGFCDSKPMGELGAQELFYCCFSGLFWWLPLTSPTLCFAAGILGWFCSTDFPENWLKTKGWDVKAKLHRKTTRRYR